MRTIRKILAAIRKADEAFNLFEKGDRIAVGFSGGKDSMALLAALERYKHFAKKDFDYVAVYLDLGFPSGRPPYLEEFADRYRAKLIIKDARFVYDALTAHRKDESHHLPCSLCSRMKKAAICEAAHELGCHKVAFAHHLDDAVETFVMNLFHGGMAATFSPKMELTRSGITFIRPLVFAREKDISRTAKEEGFPVAGKLCPADGFTERQKVKEFLKDVYEDFPQSEHNLALALLDYRRLALFFEQGESLPHGRLEAVSTPQRALLLPYKPPQGTGDTYLVYDDKGKLAGQLTIQMLDAHRYAIRGIHLPQELRKEAIAHFEAVLRQKTSPMTLMLFGLRREEKEALGYKEGPRGFYKRLI